jgi:hypothetical protein
MNPLSKPPVKMESRDERVTVRLTPTELAMFAQAAAAIGIEVSRYLRDCARMGARRSSPVFRLLLRTGLILLLIDNQRGNERQQRLSRTFVSNRLPAGSPRASSTVWLHSPMVEYSPLTATITSRSTW